MTDTEREQAIAEAREEMQQAGIRQDWKAANSAQERMRKLIRERSPEQVARMEAEQGLSVRRHTHAAQRCMMGTDRTGHRLATAVLPCTDLTADLSLLLQGQP